MFFNLFFCRILQENQKREDYDMKRFEDVAVGILIGSLLMLLAAMCGGCSTTPYMTAKSKLDVGGDVVVEETTTTTTKDGGMEVVEKSTTTKVSKSEAAADLELKKAELEGRTEAAVEESKASKFLSWLFAPPSYYPPYGYGGGYYGGGGGYVIPHHHGHHHGGGGCGSPYGDYHYRR